MMVSTTWLAAGVLLSLQVGISSSFSLHTHTNHGIISCPSRTSSHHHTTIMAATSNNNDESSSINMSDLQRRMARQENQYAKLLMEQSRYVEKEEPVPESVHIILFQPDTPKQHVHTIEFPKNSGSNMILAFESGGDCVDFARMLQDLEFVDPCPEETMFEPFAQYCEMSGLSLMIVPKGFELTPPQINANDEDEVDEEILMDEDISLISEDTTTKQLDENELDAWG